MPLLSTWQKPQCRQKVMRLRGTSFLSNYDIKASNIESTTLPEDGQWLKHACNEISDLRSWPFTASMGSSRKQLHKLERFRLPIEVGVPHHQQNLQLSCLDLSSVLNETASLISGPSYTNHCLPSVGNSTIYHIMHVFDWTYSWQCACKIPP